MKTQSGPFFGDEGPTDDGDLQEIRNLDPDVDLDMFAAEPSHAPTAPAAAVQVEPSRELTMAAAAGSGPAWRSSRLSAPVVLGLAAVVTLAVIVGTLRWLDAPQAGGVQDVTAPPPPPIVAAVSPSTVTTDPAASGDARSAALEEPAAAPPTMAEPAPVAPPAPKPPPLAAGWLRIDAPVDLDISSEGRVIGTSRADRTMLPAGKYDLVFANERVGYRDRQTVTVIPGETRTIRIRIPGGTLSVNAQPWAMVSIDGTPVGETPFADMELPAGVHEVVFTHPQFGVRRVEALVRSGQHARLGVDLRIP